jgi:hypothetical protein
MKVNLAHTFIRPSRTLIFQLSQNICYVMVMMMKVMMMMLMMIITIIIYINTDFFTSIFTYNLKSFAVATHEIVGL